MQEKLSALAAHLTEVEQQLADPAVYTDREKLTALRREQKELAPVVECWQAYLRAQERLRGLPSEICREVRAALCAAV